MNVVEPASPTAERVMDAAEALIQQRGYGGFSYDDVAQAVGIRKPSVHHHFRTKAELVTELTHRYTLRFELALSAIDMARRDPLVRLKAYVRLFSETYANQGRLCVCGMLGAEADALPASVAEAVEAFFRLNLTWLTAAFRDAQQSGQVRADLRAAGLAEALLAALEGSMVLGRGLRAGGGPSAVGRTFLATVRV